VHVAPGRHVAARGVHRDRLLPGDKARLHLKLEIGHGRLLRLGEALDVAMGELDLALELVGHHGAGGLDLGLGQDRVALVLVELAGVFQRLRVAARLDVVEDALDDRMHVRGVAGRGQFCFFQVFTGH
jgi:hypothetical protein